MKITIEPETPAEIQHYKRTTFQGVQTMLVLGLIHDEMKVEQGMHSIWGNTMLLMDQIQVLHHQLMHSRLQAAAQQQQHRIQVPNMKFVDGDGKRIV